MDNGDMEPLRSMSGDVVPPSQPIDVPAPRVPLYFKWAAFAFGLQALLLLADQFLEVRGVNSLALSRVLLGGMWACSSLMVWGWFHNQQWPRKRAMAVCLVLASGAMLMDRVIPKPPPAASQSGDGPKTPTAAEIADEVVRRTGATVVAPVPGATQSTARQSAQPIIYMGCSHVQFPKAPFEELRFLNVSVPKQEFALMTITGTSNRMWAGVDPIYRCEVANYTSQPVFRVVLEFTYVVTESTKVNSMWTTGDVADQHPPTKEPISIPRLDQDGGKIVFYVWNPGSPNFVDVTSAEEATLELKDSPRRLKVKLKLSESSGPIKMLFSPTQR